MIEGNVNFTPSSMKEWALLSINKIIEIAMVLIHNTVAILFERQ